MGIAIILGICGFCVLVLGVRTQNRLAPLRQRVDEAASNIQVCVQKRNRLIKQLLEIAATSAKHEKELYERISADFNTPSEIDRNPKAALAYVSRLTNTYPELRADRTYLSLTADLSNLEGELQNRHEQHNASVREYNSVRLSFPNDVFAWFGGYGVAAYLGGAESPGAEAQKQTQANTKWGGAILACTILGLFLILVLGYMAVSDKSSSGTASNGSNLSDSGSQKYIPISTKGWTVFKTHGKKVVMMHVITNGVDLQYFVGVNGNQNPKTLPDGGNVPFGDEKLISEFYFMLKANQGYENALLPLTVE